MIEYEPGKYGIGFIFSCQGSVFPKALLWSIPATALSLLLHALVEHNENMSVSQVWSAYNFILGFLVVFRTQQAYSRFWEGATILQQVRGEWFNAVSSCFAFCSANPDKAKEVDRFQHLLVRLASLLYCTALQQIAVLSDEAFEILDLEGIDTDHLEYLAHAPEKVLVILQWVQRLIVQNTELGVITVPPPILSRVYQELSRGIVNIVNAQKITDIIFPFPYAQMVTVMLMVTTLISPYMMAVLMMDVAWCGLLTFVSVFAFWSLNYIAAEIEMPFGEDQNDLPISQLQEGFNMALRMLLDDVSRNPPAFNFVPELHGSCESVKCPFRLITDVQHKTWGSCHAKLKQALKRASQHGRGDRVTKAMVRKMVNEPRGKTSICNTRRSQALRERVSRFSDSFGSMYDSQSVNSGIAKVRSELPGVNHESSMDTTAFGSGGDTLRGSDTLNESKNDDKLAPESRGADALITAPSEPFTQPAPVVLPEQIKGTLAVPLLSGTHRLDEKLVGAIMRMQKHFSRISEDLTFITRHSSWPGVQAERAVPPDVGVVKLSASIETNCCSIAKSIGNLAVVLCMMEAESLQIPSWLNESDGFVQPNLSDPTELRLPL